MSADPPVPPGLGIDPETLRKSKERNPRRRAQKAATKKLREPAGTALEASLNAQSYVQTEGFEASSSAQATDTSTIRKESLEPTTQSLLARLQHGAKPQVEAESSLIEVASESGTRPGSQAPDLYYAAPPAGAKARRPQQRRARQKAVRAAKVQAQSAEAARLDEQSSARLRIGTETTILDHFSHGQTIPLTQASPVPAEGWPEMPEANIGFCESGQDLMAEGMTVLLSKSPLVCNEGWSDVPPGPAAEIGWPDLADKRSATQINISHAWEQQPSGQTKGFKHQQRPPLRSGANVRTGFARHLSRSRLQEALKTGRVLRADFRVNAVDRRQAFVGMEGLPADIQIQGQEDQNRAIHGDVVAVEINPQAEWLSQRVTILRGTRGAIEGTPDNPNLVALEEMFNKLGTTPLDFVVDKKLLSAGSPEAAKQVLIDKLKERPDLRATGRVVAILEPSFRRERVVGGLQLEDWGGFTLVPADTRLPKGRVPASKVPDAVKESLKNLGDDPEAWLLVSGMIEAWHESSRHPDMIVREAIGQAGEIEIETRAILEAEGVDLEDFSADVHACLPAVPWSIVQEEVNRRLDLRHLRLFTIDPPTARDLDDALSIETLGDGRWRVGVHIADVAHFIPPGSALDAKAAVRATSVYLVQRVVPMLPALLCEQLCSLNPGVDRLSFSVIWELDLDGNILSQWTGKTVIRSCTKLAYGAAQQMIEGDFIGADGQEPPCELESPHTWREVVEDVLALNRIARNLHRRRFENGALRLDNVKLVFRLDAEGNPSSCEAHEQREANEMVAEFMLLANMSIAQLIGVAFRDRAMLRRHVPPEERKMGELEDAAQRLGYDIDTSTAGTIQEALRRLQAEGEDPVVLNILQLFISKPMKQAQYFSTGTLPQMGDWRHFALAVPMYTHFTSPIRRYPDVIVHRLLADLLAKDPAAATQTFIVAPIGSLERDIADGVFPRSKKSENGALGAFQEILAAGEEVYSSDEAESEIAEEVDTTEQQSMQAGSSSINAGTAARGGNTPPADVVAQPEADDLAVSAEIDAALAEKDSVSGKVDASLQDNRSASGTIAAFQEEASAPATLAASTQGRGDVEESTAGNGRAVPRLLAKKNASEKKNAREKKHGGKRAAGKRSCLPVSTELLDSDALEVVARHCNERKTSAKLCSEASGRLYLCLMLKKEPMVVEGFATAVNGQKFFDVYIPDFGLSERIQTSEILPAALPHWDKDQRILRLEEDVTLGGAAAREDRGSTPCLSTVRNAANLFNPKNIQPAMLPLEVKGLTRLAVVVSARSPAVGKPLATYALLYLHAATAEARERPESLS